jgi:hypothetical protein
MINLKDYAEQIKAAVAIENGKDENWKWSVKSVGKTIAHIAWGYLDYCGGWDGKKTFTISTEQDDCFGDTISANHPHGGMITFLAVGGRFKDADTPEEAIERVIRGIARTAHSTY